MYFCLSFCNIFPREARNELAQPMEVNALEGALVEAVSDRFPRFTAVHQCAQVSVSVEPKMGCLDIQLGMRLPRLLRFFLSVRDDTYSCMVTRYGPFTKFLKHMRIAMEIACFRHREIEKCPVNPRQCAFVPLAVESFLVKSGCAISRTCGKNDQKMAALPASQSVKV